VAVKVGVHLNLPNHIVKPVAAFGRMSGADLAESSAARAVSSALQVDCVYTVNNGGIAKLQI
jgi:hypothetical protein